MVDEIRLHGMGGQGVVACGELIAISASYEDKFCRACARSYKYYSCWLCVEGKATASQEHADDHDCPQDTLYRLS